MARPANESALPFPPYGSFISFLNDLNAMEVLPNQLNSQVFAASYSGSARVQILRAFRAFSLVGENNAPIEARLRPLLNPDTRKGAIVDLLNEVYKSLIELPLETAGPAEVSGWFNGIGMDPASTRKAKSFFLAAAKDNGIKIHSLVLDRSVRRSTPRGPSRRKNGSKKPPADQPSNQLPNLPPPDFGGVLFHPAVDAFLREARKLTEGDSWSTEARDHVVAGFTTQLDLFLPVKNKKAPG